MNARRLALTITVALYASVAGLALSNTAAFAEVQRPLLYELMGTPGGAFGTDVCGVALDSATQDLYVADRGNDAIDIFEPSGTGSYIYKSQISGLGVLPPIRPSYFACTLAVSDETGDVYLAPTTEASDTVYVFNELSGWSTMTGSETPSKEFGGISVAVDNSTESSDPDKGDVYVTDNDHEVVDRFGPNNKYLGRLVPACKHTETCPAFVGFAFNASGEGYLATRNGDIMRFSSSGKEILPLITTTEGRGSLTGIAVGSTGDLYATLGELASKHGEVYELDPAGAFLSATNVIPSQHLEPLGVVAGAGGELYVADAGERCSGSNPSCVEMDGVVRVFGTAVTFPDAVSGEASSVTDTDATVAGTVDPEGLATTYQFEYGTSTGYGSVSPASPANVEPTDSSVHAETASLAGLQSSTVYHYRIVATAAGGRTSYGADKTFRTSGPPTIAGVAVAGVTHTSASIRAEVNPGGSDTDVYVEYGTSTAYDSSSASVDIGSGTTPVGIGSGTAGQPPAIELSGLRVGTTYHFRVVASHSSGTPVDGADGTLATEPAALVAGEFVSEVGTTGATLNARVNDFGVASTYFYEYGPTSAYGSTTPQGNLTGGGGEVNAPARITGLQPDSAYHYRIVLSNGFGGVPGNDLLFRTFPPTISTLPDGRVYEMVDPVANADGNVYVPDTKSVTGTAENGVPTTRPFEAAPDGDAVVYPGDPPSVGGNGSIGEGLGNEFLARRSAAGGWTQVDLQPSGGFLAPTYLGFSSDLSVGVLTAGDELSGLAPRGYENLYAHPLGEAGYEPLLTNTPPNRAPGEFGSVPISGNKTGLGYAYAGGTPSLGHMLFEANDALTAGAGASPPSVKENDLYDSVEGRLYAVNVLPGGVVAPNASFGSPPTVNANAPGFGHVISADGSRVFWTAVDSSYRPEALYVRENDTQPESPVAGGVCTVVVDACTVQVDAAEAGAAGPGGGGQFWTAGSDGSRVFFTDSATAGLTTDTVPGSGVNLYEYEVSSGHLSDLTPASEAGVEGVLGASKDGEYVYFVAAGSLSAGASAGQPNLYLWHGGVTTFIATLTAKDNEVLPFTGAGVGEMGDWQVDVGRHTAEVTPDGHGLVFMSQRSLTGYDNETKSGERLFEVFDYDADRQQLACVSCNPSGAIPVTTPFKGDIGGFVPISWNNGYQPRVISDDGDRVFFDSAEPLVSQATSGWIEVYEWERDDTGSCRQSQGCIYLLSGGSSPDNSYLVDASASGDNVFFVTPAQLLPQDRNDDDDLYDARVGGVQPLAPSACTGTGCQGAPPAQPIFATPSSVTFSGTGNFPAPPTTSMVKPKAKGKPAACKKGFVKKRGKCVKKPRSRKNAGDRPSKKAGKSSRARRAG